MAGRKKIISLILVIVLVFGISIQAQAVGKTDILGQVEKSVKYMVKTVAGPQVGAIGGDWVVIGLARSGCTVPKDYYEEYYATVESYVKARSGILHAQKYTEYSRLIVALTAIGKDPANVVGYNLLTPLGDFDKTIWQGINGPIWALIALDVGNYAMPHNTEAKMQATRQMYVDYILDKQLSDGGWSLAGIGSSDPDMTGMALQALAKYQMQDRVKTATYKAIDCLSGMQEKNGGFLSGGITSSESAVQVLIAMCELGIDISDARFVKNENTILDNLLTFSKTDGSFAHVLNGGNGSNQMATEQALCGIVAALRSVTGQNSLYCMNNAISIGGGTNVVKGDGLPGKNIDVKSMPITASGTTFSDVIYSNNIAAIEALSARGIINGKGNGLFEPDTNMTRAEFAAIVTRGLGLNENDTGIFTDVTSDKWYAGYIGTANRYGIIYGIGGGLFNPEGTLNSEEAAVMVARAASLCGLDISISAAEIRDILSQFGDYVTIADWAQESMAFCYSQDILDQSAINVAPDTAIARCEIAQMLFNMLTKANLV